MKSNFKMDNNTKEEKTIKPERVSFRSAFFVLSGAVLVLAVAFVIVIACGVWYINNLSNQSNNEDDLSDDLKKLSSPREYYMKLISMSQMEDNITHVYVNVDEENSLEYIVMKDPFKMHTQAMAMVDYGKDYVILWGSEINECMFIEGTQSSIVEELQFLWSHNEQEIQPPRKKTQIVRSEKIVDMTLIPHQMASFCTLSNSYWMRSAKEDDVTELPACMCLPSHCWCTYCKVPDCWGYCHCCCRCGCCPPTNKDN